MIDRLKKIVDEEGISGVFRRIKRKFYKELDLMVIDSQAKEKDLPEGYRLEALSAELVENGHRTEPNLIDKRRYKIFMDRLVNEDFHGLFLISKDNRIAAWAFLRTDYINFDSLMENIRLKEGEGYIEDLYTSPFARRQGCQQYLYYMLRKKHPLDMVFISYDATNYKSAKLIEGFGARLVKKYRFIKILGKTFRLS